MDTSNSTTDTRCCNTCNETFPLTTEYWYRDKKGRGGFGYSCKPCTRKRSSDWLGENRERNKETCRTRYANKRETYVEYRQEHASEIAETKRKWRKNNPDKVKRHKSESQRRNRASANERSKRFRQRHPDRCRTWTRIGIHRRNHVPGKFTKQDVELQYRSQRGLCWWCGELVGDEYHIDHVIPLKRGGTNDPRNIVISCPVCNMSKGAKLPQEWNGRLF